MKTKNNHNDLQAKDFIRPAVITFLILAIPFSAMMFDWQVYDPGNPIPERVDWSAFDFIVAGALLFGTGLTYELIARKAGTTAHKIALALVLLIALFLIWAELAVGIFGTPLAGD